MKKRKLLIFTVLAAVILALAGGCAKTDDTVDRDQTIASGQLRNVVFSLVSSAENSSLDYEKQYSYIEDIGDGRGYTAGIIGFTTGTGDLLDVVLEYTNLQPDNVLEKYIPALENVIGTDSHEGLDPSFANDWIEASADPQMILAQDKILDDMYLSPAVEYAADDGLSALGQYIYYDALVVHGPGEDEDSFQGIRAAAIKECRTPAQGGSEEEYLLTFLDRRTKIMLKEEAHSDLSRIETQRSFIQDGNYNLEPPLKWTMYGDDFELRGEDVEQGR